VLHDTVEDTVTLSAELASVFNADIANLVAEVTDDKTLSKVQRKQLQIEHAAAMSERAKILKLADKTSNLRSLVKSPPSDWSLQRRKEYLDWALDVARGLRGVNPWLEARFDEAAEQLAKRLRSSDEGGRTEIDNLKMELDEKPPYRPAPGEKTQ